MPSVPAGVNRNVEPFVTQVKSGFATPLTEIAVTVTVPPTAVIAPSAGGPSLAASEPAVPAVPESVAPSGPAPPSLPAAPAAPVVPAAPAPAAPVVPAT